MSPGRSGRALLFLATPLAVEAGRFGLRRAASADRTAGSGRLCELPPQAGFDQALDIYANKNDNTRSIQFGGFGTDKGGDGFGIETMVKCKGDLPASCLTSTNNTCAECPCERDLTLYGNYQEHMAKYLVPLCTNPPDQSRKDPFRVLLVGLGGGGLPEFIMSKCPKGTRVESVEYDPRMIEAASRYFGLHLQQGTNEVVQGDGGEIVQQRANQGEKYDMVLVDAFSGPFQVPESCRDEKFVRNVQLLVRKNGMALQNIEMGDYEKTLPLYRKVFGDDAVDSESLAGNGEMAVGHLIVAEAPWGA